MPSLDLEFNELPLLIDLDGYHSAPVDGVAEIIFHDSQDWCIAGITLTGYRRASAEEVEKTGVFVQKWVPLDPQQHEWLYNQICERLEHAPLLATVKAEIIAHMEDAIG
jgi:hypothetical protein